MPGTWNGRSLIVATCSLAIAARAIAWQPVEYTVALPAPQTQNMEISMVVPDVATPTLDLQMPIWRPGRYTVLDPASAVRNVRASDANNQPLPIEKVDKSTWRVLTKGPGAVRIDYRMYANALAERGRHVDDTHAFLDGALTFMYVPQRRGIPVRVHIDAPADWQIACGLDSLPGNPRTLAAPNYDILVDSPIEIGIHDQLAFEVFGVPHQIVIWGEADYDAEQLKKDFARIVQTEAAIFGDDERPLPYKRFMFILHVGAGAAGGTEHLNSTIMQISRAALEDKVAYKRFLGLVAHEMFHTWNVKQFRPADIHPYDYQRENYSKLFWVVEGTTTYYTQLALVRSGLKEPQDYFKTLSDEIDSLRKRPGELVQSLDQSSFDSWIQHGRTSPDHVNSTVSFYTKGALVSLLLDMAIRERSGNRGSLDSVLRLLYERFPLSGAGYTREDFIRVIEEVAGSPFKDFFSRFVAGAEPLDLEAKLAVVGLELHLKPSKDDDEADTKDQPEDDEPPESNAPPKATPAVRQSAYLGLNLNDQNGRAVVTSVLSDGPAHAAGILPGDEVIALDGRKLAASDLSSRLKKLKPGQAVQLTLFRRDQLRTISIALSGMPDGKWTIRRVKEPSESQKAAYESWLAQPWPKE